MNLQEKMKSIKMTYITMSLIYILVYAIGITLIYFIEKTITTFDFLVISICMVIFIFIAHAHTFISSQKKYFQLQELLQNSNMTDEELAEKSKMSIDKIKLLKMEFYIYTDKDMKILKNILRDK